MKCPECQAALGAPRRVPWRHDALRWVVLEDIAVHTCSRCGERLTAIPSVDALHQTLAAAVARRAGRSGPSEIRFLFAYLDWTHALASSLLGVDRATVSRWVSRRRPQTIGPAADRLLRLVAVRDQPVTLDEIAAAVDSADAPAPEVRLRFERHWTVMR